MPELYPGICEHCHWGHYECDLHFYINCQKEGGKIVKCSNYKPGRPSRIRGWWAYHKELRKIDKDYDNYAKWKKQGGGA